LLAGPTYFSSLRIRAPTTNFHVSPSNVFPRICISLLVHAREEEEKEHKTFPLVYGRSEVFVCNFFTVAPRSRIFFRTLLAALNGQIRLSHLNTRYRPQNRDGDRKSEESLKTGPCNLISSDVIKAIAREISLLRVMKRRGYVRKHDGGTVKRDNSWRPRRMDEFWLF